MISLRMTTFCCNKKMICPGIYTRFLYIFPVPFKLPVHTTYSFCCFNKSKLHFHPFFHFFLKVSWKYKVRLKIYRVIPPSNPGRKIYNSLSKTHPIRMMSIRSSNCRNLLLNSLLIVMKRYLFPNRYTFTAVRADINILPAVH